MSIPILVFVVENPLYIKSMYCHSNLFIVCYGIVDVFEGYEDTTIESNKRI